MKAFAVTCNAFDPPIVSVTWALTASKARYINMLAAQDVGYALDFKDFDVKRISELDNHPDKKENVCRSIELYKEKLEKL